MAPVKGPFSFVVPMISLVVPMTVTLDDYRSVALMIVPAAMQPAVMFVELGTRAAIVISVAVVISITPDPDAKTLTACHVARTH
jgi:hypothetical protein